MMSEGPGFFPNHNLSTKPADQAEKEDNYDGTEHFS